MEVVGRVRRDSGVPIEPSALFERDTVLAWAEHVRGLLEDGDDAPADDAGDASARRWESADTLAAVSVLAPDIGPAKGVPSPSPGSLRRVLLTGATGFVGAYLLDELLRHGTEEVHCLVRCSEPADGLRRITENAAALRPLDAAARARIRVVPGDLAAEGLGLSAGDRRSLAGGLDAICHNGAWVNFAHTFDQLRPANVAGTEELLRLAAQSDTPLHHVSTYGIFGLPVEGRDLVLEGDDVRTAGRLVTGYVQSKWAAEHLVHQAAQRGMPVAIYRLGRVVGDSRTGLALTSHFTSRVIKGCIQLGAAPDLDIEIEMTPVDYVARALVHLMAHRPADGSSYHLVNRRHMPFAGLVTHLERRGWPLEVLPPDEWWQRLEGAIDSHANELHPVMGTVRELVVGGERAIAYDAQCVERALEGTGIACPPLDTRLLDAHLDYFVRTGHLSTNDAATR
jgi:thioester reductase-like protein